MSRASELTPNIPAIDPAPVSVKKIEKRVRIVLEDNDKIPPTGQFFQLNGKAYILRAGEEAEVPIGIIEILDNAVESAPVRDGAQRVVGFRNRHRFPYRLVRRDHEPRSAA